MPEAPLVLRPQGGEDFGGWVCCTAFAEVSVAGAVSVVLTDPHRGHDHDPALA